MKDHEDWKQLGIGTEMKSHTEETSKYQRGSSLALAGQGRSTRK